MDSLVARDVLTAILHRESGTMLTAHVAVIGGNRPRLVVVAGDGDHVRLRAAAIAGHPELRGLECEYLSATTDWNATVRTDRLDNPEARPRPHLPDVPWLDLAEQVSARRKRRARQMLLDIENGAWADTLLRDNGIHVQLEAHADDRLYPLRKVLVLDAGKSDAELAAAMFAGAMDIWHELNAGTDPVRDLTNPDRAQDPDGTEYLRIRLQEEAETQAARAEAMRQLREVGYDTEPPDAIERVYTAAHRHVLDGVGHGRTPAAAEHALAWQAGIAAVRPLLDRVGPRLTGGTYADFYRRAWSEARGVASVDAAMFDRVLAEAFEDDLDLAVGADSAVEPRTELDVRGRLTELVLERSAAAGRREQARADLIELTDAELAELGPVSAELELLRRAPGPRTRTLVATIDGYHHGEAQVDLLDAAIDAYVDADRQRATCDLLAFELSQDPMQVRPGTTVMVELTRQRNKARAELAEFLDIEPGRVTADQAYNLLGQAEQHQQFPLPPDDPRRFLFADRTVTLCERFLALDPIVRAVDRLRDCEAHARQLGERAHPTVPEPKPAATRIVEQLAEVPSLGPDERAAVTVVLTKALAHSGAELWPVERLGTGHRIQVRDGAGRKLVHIEMTDGVVRVRTYLRRDQRARVLLAQQLVPDLMTGWTDSGEVTRAFTTVLERMSGIGVRPPVRPTEGTGEFTMELSGPHGSRQLDVTVETDRGSFALYFDEGEEDSQGGRGNRGPFPGPDVSGRPTGNMVSEVEAARRGDAAAFDRLARRYEQAMFLAVMSYVADRDTAESITAAALRRARADIDRIGDGSEARAWFVRRALDEVAAAAPTDRPDVFHAVNGRLSSDAWAFAPLGRLRGDVAGADGVLAEIGGSRTERPRRPFGPADTAISSYESPGVRKQTGAPPRAVIGAGADNLSDSPAERPRKLLGPDARRLGLPEPPEVSVASRGASAPALRTGWQLRWTEVGLARHLNQQSDTKTVAAEVLDQVWAVMGRLHPAATEAQRRAAFGASPRPRWGGIVSDEVPLSELKRDGNLRELWSAIMNALIRNAELEEQDRAGTTVLEGIARILDQPDWEDKAAAAGLNVRSLAPVVAAIREDKPDRMITAEDLRQVEYLRVRDPIADAVFEDEYALRERFAPVRSQAEQRRWQLTPREFELLGKKLSPREFAVFSGKMNVLVIKNLAPHPGIPRRPNGSVDEKALDLILRGDPTVQYCKPIYVRDEHGGYPLDSHGHRVVDTIQVYHLVDEVTPEQAMRLDPTQYVVEVPLRPGTSYAGLNPDDPQYHKLVLGRGTSNITGVSGTATRLWRYLEWIGVDVPALELIASLMGLMLPEHHTAYEFFRGLDMAGVHLFDESVYHSPGARDMYRAMHHIFGPREPGEAVSGLSGTAGPDATTSYAPLLDEDAALDRPVRNVRRAAVGMEFHHREDGLEWNAGANAAPDTTRPDAPKSEIREEPPGGTSKDQLTGLIKDLVAQKNWGQAIAVLQQRFGDKLYRSISRRFGDSPLAREITDEAITRAVDTLHRMPDSLDIELWIVDKAERLIPQYDMFVEFRRRIASAVAAFGDADTAARPVPDTVGQLVEVVDTATLTQLHQAMESPLLSDPQRELLDALWPASQRPRTGSAGTGIGRPGGMTIVVAARILAHQLRADTGQEKPAGPQNPAEIPDHDHSSPLDEIGDSGVGVTGMVSDDSGVGVAEVVPDDSGVGVVEGAPVESGADLTELDIAREYMEVFRRLGTSSDAEIAHSVGVTRESLYRLYVEIAKRLNIDYYRSLARAADDLMESEGAQEDARGTRRRVRPAHFPARHAELLRLFDEGKTPRQCAVAMGLSPNTIQKYTQQIGSRVGLKLRDAILSRVVELGIIEASPRESGQVRFSDRETQIIEARSRGMSYAEAAGQLGISTETAYSTGKDILHKLSAGSWTEVFDFAVAEGMIQEPWEVRLERIVLRLLAGGHSIASAATALNHSPAWLISRAAALATELGVAVHSIGERWTVNHNTTLVATGVRCRVIDAPPQFPIVLTQRERAILAARARGRTAEQAAGDVGLSPGAVHRILAELREVTHSQTTTELVAKTIHQLDSTAAGFGGPQHAELMRVLIMIACGHGRKEIAAEFGRSLGWVNIRYTALAGAFGVVDNQAALVAAAIRGKVLEPLHTANEHFFDDAEERRIILLKAEGMSDQAIAAELGIPFKTVRTVMARLKKLTGSGTTGQLIAKTTHLVDAAEARIADATGKYEAPSARGDVPSGRIRQTLNTAARAMRRAAARPAAAVPESHIAATPTARELTAIRQVAAGLSPNVVARNLDVTAPTIRADLDSLATKLGTDRRTLTRVAKSVLAAAEGIVEPAEPTGDFASLTDFEKSVLRLLPRRLSDAAAARELDASTRGVQQARNKLRTKLGTSDIDAIIEWAVQGGHAEASDDTGARLEPGEADPALRTSVEHLLAVGESTGAAAVPEPFQVPLQARGVPAEPEPEVATEWTEPVPVTADGLEAFQCGPKVVEDVARSFRRGDIELLGRADANGVLVSAVERALGGRAQHVAGLADAVARLDARGRVLDARGEGDGIAVVVFEPAFSGRRGDLGHALWLIRHVDSDRVWFELRDPGIGEFVTHLDANFVAPQEQSADGVLALFLDQRGHPVADGIPPVVDGDLVVDGEVRWRGPGDNFAVGMAPGADPLENMHADSYRPLGAIDDPRPAMPRDVALAGLSDAARTGRELQGHNNVNYALERAGLFFRMRNGTEGVDPRAFREHHLMRLFAKYGVENVPLLYAVLTDVCTVDRWVADESKPILITSMLPGRQASASDFYSGRDQVLADYRKLWAQLDRIPEPELRALLQEEMPANRDTRGFFRWIIGKQRRLFEDMLRDNPAAAEIFDEAEIPRNIWDLVEALVDEAEPEDFTLLHGDAIPDNTMIDPFGMVDWDLALLGPRSWDKAILHHRGVAGLLSSADMTPNVKIALAILHVQRLAHDTVPAALGRVIDPGRDTTYMASFAAVREMMGKSARGCADLVRRAMGYDHRLDGDQTPDATATSVVIREIGQTSDDAEIRRITRIVEDFVARSMSDAGWPGFKRSAARAAAGRAVADALRKSDGKVVLTMHITKEPWWNLATRFTILHSGSDALGTDLPAKISDWTGGFEDTRLSPNSEGWTWSSTLTMHMRYFGTTSSDKALNRIANRRRPPSPVCWHIRGNRRCDIDPGRR